MTTTTGTASDRAATTRASTTTTSESVPYSLSRALIVTVRYQGIAIPVSGGESIELELPELLLLERLAAQLDSSVELAIEQVQQQLQAPESYVPPENTPPLPERCLITFVEQLRKHRLLLDSPEVKKQPALPSANGPAQKRQQVALRLKERPTLAIATPLPLQPTREGFTSIDHNGHPLIALSARALVATQTFALGKNRGQVLYRQLRDLYHLAYTVEEFDALLQELANCELIAPVEKVGQQGRENITIRTAMSQQMRFRGLTNTIFAKEIEDRVCEEKIRVVSFDNKTDPLPLPLGMIYAYAKEYKNGLLNKHYHFSPQAAFEPQQEDLLKDGIAIITFSNYIWSHPSNLNTSKRAKALSPNSITIHGGPDSPKYADDVDTYFRANPHVDIVIHGEGEITFAEVLEAISGHLNEEDGLDVSVLKDVPGISYRNGDRVVRTGSRDRIGDLDEIPSPFLTGLYDIYGEAKSFIAIIETNRGCPFGCTFCDWGSATASKIRKFSLERVYAELEWVAKNEIPRLIIADANFGMIKRDVDIAKKVVELKNKYGYPKLVGTNYAKNNTRYLQEIVNIFIESEIFSYGLLSLQTMDTNTLEVIDRSNIKTEKYDELAREFRAAGLPLFIDLMMGLPGSTLESFRADLQGAIDREVTAKVFQTELLVNSPMNEPGYRKENAIETIVPLQSLSDDDADRERESAYVIASSTFTRDDYNEMLAIRSVFALCENYGVLRQISRFVRQEADIEEIDFYTLVATEASKEQERWPAITGAFKLAPALGVPPVTWHYFIEEVHQFIVTTMNLPDNAALDTVLKVQHALLPARGRHFPIELQLAHDYGAWHAAIVNSKDNGNHRDWPRHVPPLSSFGPATFLIEDPNDVCRQGVGYQIEEAFNGDWELESPVRRAMPGEHLIV